MNSPFKKINMKRAIFITLLFTSLFLSNCNAGNPTHGDKKSISGNVVTQLSNDGFKKLIFNYEINKEWKYEGTKPVIIDFYADWCPPCRQLSPLVEEIAKEYEGKIVVYKVNTDKEKALTQTMGISSLPTLLFIPATGKPQITVGAMPKETLVKAVNEILLIK
jgi:thioredoxin 1